MSCSSSMAHVATCSLFLPYVARVQQPNPALLLLVGWEQALVLAPAVVPVLGRARVGPPAQPPAAVVSGAGGL